MKTMLFLIISTFIISGCCSTKNNESSFSYSETNPVLSLSRSACYGYCPTYNLTFKGNGIATYEGFNHVDRIGLFEAKVSKEQLQRLMNRFNEIKFFEMKDLYDDMVTDIPTYTVTYTLNGKTKTVTDRFGSPQELRDAEKFMDEIANSLDWKKIGDAPSK